MGQTYHLEVAGLAEAVANTAVDAKHKALTKALNVHQALHGARFANSRGAGGGRWLARRKVLDQAGAVVADDHKIWLQQQVDQDGGSVSAAYARLKDEGFTLSKCEIESLVFVVDGGGSQSNFKQVHVDVETEYIDAPLFGWFYTSPRDMIDLVDQSAPPFDDRKLLSAPRYRLGSIEDVPRFMDVARQLHEHERDRTRKAMVTLTDADPDGGGEVSVQSLASLDPQFEKYPWWKGERFIHDWTLSSAGRSGARLCQHWVFELSDYTYPEGTRQAGQRFVNLVPAWTHTFNMAEIKRGPSIHSTYDKLLSIDRRTGVPFAWFFYMLHGNRVKDWAGEMVLRAAERGEIDLPEHDYQVLRRWQERPYGF